MPAESVQPDNLTNSKDRAANSAGGLRDLSETGMESGAMANRFSEWLRSCHFTLAD
ncbi:hypothetical protein Spb1_37020 [Planctopirus ephydatiae]|uniref:Uncharacterized protein n=1 Tax=Planctopirus ephydatiae TaxID=2528019 RepID=A0A518GT37_9PLAN|nr:hypothetical protein Spb1_37020 [Planctopirus ephydatiae]